MLQKYTNSKKSDCPMYQKKGLFDSIFIGIITINYMYLFFDDIKLRQLGLFENIYCVFKCDWNFLFLLNELQHLLNKIIIDSF